jgi:transcriptional regulator with XRE-family HTH domain
MTTSAQLAVREGLETGSNSREAPTPKTLRELRHEHGLSLTKVADLSSLNKARISELERGVRWPTRDELTALGYIYGVELGVGFSVIVIGADA